MRNKFFLPKSLRGWLCVVSLAAGYVAVVPRPAWAQLTTATLYGIVTDPTGAVVPGAVVTITHEGTSAGSTRTADERGEFVFDFLRVGSYTLRIEAAGFKTYESKGIELAAAQSVRRTFAMELGAATETVTVQGTAPLINAVSAEQRESIGSLEVRELPLARRNFTGLLQLNTGVTGGGGVFRLDGAGKHGTSYTVDGTDASADGESRATTIRGNFQYINLLSVEAIQEVQTTKGIVPAEYGQVVGGSVNILTKSGTNTWHGSLFENFQAEDLNARNPFLRTKVPETFNQFGASGGGPIRKDRIFIFGAYEGYRESAFRQVSGNVPTQKLRNEMISAAPAYKTALDRLPLPNEAHAPDADVGYYLGARRLLRRDNHLVLKNDIRLRDATTLALTYTRGRPYSLSPRFHINNDQVYNGYQERGTASLVTGGPAWTAETRFGYNLNDLTRLDEIFQEHAIREEVPYGGRPPQINSSLGFSTPAGELYLVEGPNWSVEQKYARYRGQHSIKVGGKFVSYSAGKDNPETPAIRYEGKSDLLANIPAWIQATFGNGVYTGKNYELGFFAQDDWRVSRKLVMNLGVRYDFYSKMVARSKVPGIEYGFYNLDGLLDDQFHFGPVRDPKDPYDSDGWVNIGPRFGFSYDPAGNGKTVIRGGLGVMFSPQIGGMLRQAVGQKLVPFRSRLSKVEVANARLRFPAYNDDVRKVVAGYGNVAVFSVFNPQLQNPYNVHAYLGIQRELSSTLMFETAFVGSRGVKYILHRVFNQVNRATGLRPNLSLGEGYYVDNSQDSHYAAWQSSLRKRYSRHLSGSLHYTWGKALATESGDIGGYYQGMADVRVQEFFNLHPERGPADGDITHSFASNWVYDLPRLSSLGNPVARHALGGWQVSGILTATTGEPLLIMQGATRDTSRPDYVGGKTVLGDYRETLQYLNKDAFAKVPVSAVSGRTIRPGNLASGAVRGAGAWTVDFALAKNFAIKEDMRFQIRADAFNFLNHTNLTGFSTDINNSRFGKFTNARAARAVQLNARFSW